MKMCETLFIRCLQLWRDQPFRIGHSKDQAQDTESYDRKNQATLLDDKLSKRDINSSVIAILEKEPKASFIHWDIGHWSDWCASKMLSSFFLSHLNFYFPFYSQVVFIHSPFTLNSIKFNECELEGRNEIAMISYRRWKSHQDISIAFNSIKWQSVWSHMIQRDFHENVTLWRTFKLSFVAISLRFICVCVRAHEKHRQKRKRANSLSVLIKFLFCVVSSQFLFRVFAA